MSITPEAEDGFTQETSTLEVTEIDGLATIFFNQESLVELLINWGDG
tara:strand:- start:43 stop:183 length:141 start_codon:yes stop_codon:yes gene_type:complete